MLYVCDQRMYFLSFKSDSNKPELAGVIYEILIGILGEDNVSAFKNAHIICNGSNIIFLANDVLVDLKNYEVPEFKNNAGIVTWGMNNFFSIPRQDRTFQIVAAFWNVIAVSDFCVLDVGIRGQQFVQSFFEGQEYSPCKIIDRDEASPYVWINFTAKESLFSTSFVSREELRGIIDAFQRSESIQST